MKDSKKTKKTKNSNKIISFMSFEFIANLKFYKITP